MAWPWSWGSSAGILFIRQVGKIEKETRNEDQSLISAEALQEPLGPLNLPPTQ